jgi:hypothetical protein
MGNYTSILGTFQKAGNLKSVKFFVNDNVDDSNPDLNVFKDGYLSMLKDDVTNSSNLFIRLENLYSTPQSDIVWIHIPNTLTNHELYELLQYYVVVNNTFTLIDFGDNNLFYNTSTIIGLSLLPFTYLSKNKYLFFSNILILLTFVIIFSVLNNKPPKVFYNLNNIPNEPLLPLVKSLSTTKSIIKAKDLNEFATKVLNILKNNNGIPFVPFVDKEKQVTFVHESTTSSIIYSDEVFNVEFVSVAPKSNIVAHSHNMDVYVIALTDGMIFVNKNNEENNRKMYDLIKIDKNELHSFKTGEKGGALLTMYEKNSSTPSLFTDF